jgi:hypothetical protein
VSLYRFRQICGVERHLPFLPRNQRGLATSPRTSLHRRAGQFCRNGTPESEHGRCSGIRRRDTLIAMPHLFQTRDDVGGRALAVFFPLGACYVCLRYQLAASEKLPARCVSVPLDECSRNTLQSISIAISTSYLFQIFSKTSNTRWE